MLGVLLRLSRTIRRNRFSRMSAARKLALLAGLLGAAAGLVLIGETLLRPSDPQGLGQRVENWAFWCMAVSALCYGYTSFEIFYRNPTARRLDLLPVPASSVFAWKTLEVYRIHLALLLLPVLSGLPLLWSGLSQAWVRGVATTGATLLWGLAAAIWVHVWTGASLLTGRTTMKNYFAQGFGPPETALLFYGPAMALTAGVSVGVFADLGMGTGFDKGIWGPMGILAGLLTGGAGLALFKARTLFVETHHLFAPRFADAEVLPPWREDHLPRRYFGEGLGRWLPERVRALWSRDLRQYRRRFRIVLPLLVVAMATVVLYALHNAGSDGSPVRLAAATAILGIVVFTPVFRVAGPELGTRFDARALPVRTEDERLCQWWLAGSEWLPLIASAGCASLIGGYGVGTLGVLAALLVAFTVTNAIAIPLALRSSPDVAAVGVAVRGGLVLAVGLSAALFEQIGL